MTACCETRRRQDEKKISYSGAYVSCVPCHIVRMIKETRIARTDRVYPPMAAPKATRVCPWHQDKHKARIEEKMH